MAVREFADFRQKKVLIPGEIFEEGRRGLNEVVPGNSVFPLSETGVLGDFWVASRVPSTVSHFKTEPGTSFETL